MYLCEICETAFDMPSRLATGFGMSESVCPVCGNPHFNEANQCPKCGQWKQERAILCPACRKELVRRFNAFADKLTAEEEEQMDAWLDGDSVTDRRSWR